MKKRSIVIAFISIIIMSILLISYTYSTNNKITKEFKTDDIIIDVDITFYEQLVENYNKYVKTTKEISLYNNKFEKIGTISDGIEIELEEITLDKTTKFYQTKINDEIYYIDYHNLEKIDNIKKNLRYKNYIKFNENIITNDKTTFYTDDKKEMYTINKSFELPIIIKEEDMYGVEFDNKLLFIKKEDINETKENNNTEDNNSKGIPVLNYHYIYDENDKSCVSEICHSIKQIEQHFTYLKDNNFFTPTMKELELYIDGKIQLPKKSVVITFDDGTGNLLVKKYADEYQLNATIFLITSWFNKQDFESEYVEIHSHGDNIHNGGLCAGGQGGEIKCMEHDKLLNDLKTSREKLNNTTVFCYPFYEYNNYSIKVLKEAGFTMAFAGEYAGGKTKVTVGADKFRLPRWVIVNYTTMGKFKSYVNGWV